MAALFNSLEPQILFQEVPDEVSLTFTITGCNLGCEGCHSRHIWDPQVGQELSNERFREYLDRYWDFITCVTFFGGEWNPDRLVEILKFTRKQGLKTCLYTGQTRVSKRISNNLDYLKTGKWVFNLGGLDSRATNQKLINVQSGEILNYRFIGE